MSLPQKVWSSPRGRKFLAEQIEKIHPTKLSVPYGVRRLALALQEGRTGVESLRAVNHVKIAYSEKGS